VFGWLHLIPTQRAVQVMAEGIRWNYTSWLDVAALVVALLLTIRFVRTGGPAMLRMM
jgi:hypothetical protein